jgi:hypothetical protein
VIEKINAYGIFVGKLEGKKPQSKQAVYAYRVVRC